MQFISRLFIGQQRSHDNFPGLSLGNLFTPPFIVCKVLLAKTGHVITSQDSHWSTHNSSRHFLGGAKSRGLGYSWWRVCYQWDYNFYFSLKKIIHTFCINFGKFPLFLDWGDVLGQKNVFFLSFQKKY